MSQDLTAQTNKDSKPHINLENVVANATKLIAIYERCSKQTLSQKAWQSFGTLPYILPTLGYKQSTFLAIAGKFEEQKTKLIKKYADEACSDLLVEARAMEMKYYQLLKLLEKSSPNGKVVR